MSVKISKLDGRLLTFNGQQWVRAVCVSDPPDDPTIMVGIMLESPAVGKQLAVSIGCPGQSNLIALLSPDEALDLCEYLFGLVMMMDQSLATAFVPPVTVQ